MRTAAQALSDLSGSASRPASDAQLRSLENFLGSVPVDLRAYFGVTAKPGYGLAPTGTETSALSLGEALRETKALRRHGADPGLLEDARAFREVADARIARGVVSDDHDRLDAFRLHLPGDLRDGLA